MRACFRCRPFRDVWKVLEDSWKTCLASLSLNYHRETSRLELMFQIFSHLNASKFCGLIAKIAYIFLSPFNCLIDLGRWYMVMETVWATNIA